MKKILLFIAVIISISFAKTPMELLKENACYWPRMPEKVENGELKLLKACPKLFSEKNKDGSVKFKTKKIDGDNVLIVSWTRTETSQYGKNKITGTTKFVVGESMGKEGLYVYENKMDCKGYSCKFFDEQFQRELTLLGSVVQTFDISMVRGFWGRNYSIDKEEAVYFSLNDMMSKTVETLMMKSLMGSSVISFDALNPYVFVVSTMIPRMLDFKCMFCEESEKKENEKEISNVQNVQRCEEKEPLITDDKKRYKTVKIGEQTWMAENLSSKNGWYMWCNGKVKKDCKKYGKVYTWAQAKSECPSGWHLPSKEEFETLIDAVGGVSVAGKKLKAISTWDKNGNGTDEFCFTANASGYYNSEAEWSESGLGELACFWTSTKKNGDAFVLQLDNDKDESRLERFYSQDGCSIRCVKDEMQNNCENDDGLCDSRDGKKYRTVKIGDQEWMAENLNFFSEKINKASWCYGNEESNCEKYGRLYTWAIAMDSVGVYSVDAKGCGFGKQCNHSKKVRGICPVGWHLPDKSEWMTLWKEIGGVEKAGSKLKSAEGWSSEVAGIDYYGFSILPAGYYGGSYFYGLNLCSAFWTSTEKNFDLSFAAYVDDRERMGIDEYEHSKKEGRSVRCIKD